MSDKLDRLVAEKVMGWTHSQDNPWGYPPSSGPWWKVVPQRKWSPYETLHVSNVPDFSGDIAASWDVVEHLRTRKDDPMVITALDNDDGEYVIAFASRADRWTTRELGKHRDAPTAICLAALRAVGVPESEIQEAMR